MAGPSRRLARGSIMSTSGRTDLLTARPLPPPGTTAGGWTWAALVVALAGLSGSLFLSLGMSYKACPLCFYQGSS
jgi:hypothetical protein